MMRKLFILITIIFISGCFPAKEELKFDNSHVIFISIDTLRADRLRIYGYKHNTSPHIDSFAKDAILFKWAFSPVPLTLPAHVSLLSGLSVKSHKVLDNIGYVPSKDIKFIQQYLAEQGYETWAAISSFILRKETGIARGFSRYEDSIIRESNKVLSASQRNGFETLKIVQEWLNDKVPEKLFLFFHIYEPHSPYTPPRKFDRFNDLYDGEVRTSDEIVGKLFELLKAKGIYDNSIIALFGDHGEGLGDHGEIEHGVLMYKEAIHVPLLIKLPNSSLGGKTVEAIVSLEDLTPTILSLIGSKPLSSIDGRIILPDAPEDRVLFGVTFYPRIHFGWSEVYSVVDNEFHYIEFPTPELYRFKEDRYEKNNLITTNKKELFALRERLAKWRFPFVPPSSVDPDLSEELAALGYLTGGVKEATLEDPRDKIHLLNELTKAIKLYNQKKYKQAIEKLEKILQESDTIVDAWEYLGRSYTETFNFKQAEEAFKRALDLSGGAPHIALTFARFYLRFKMPDKAIPLIAIAETALPSEAYELYARSYLDRGQLIKAEEYIEKAIQENPNNPTFYLLKAEIYKRRGVLSAALNSIDKALELSEEKVPEGVWAAKGDILARMERFDEAEKFFEKEVLLYPQTLNAYKGLAFIYARKGKIDKLQKLINDMLAYNDNALGYIEAARTLSALGDIQGAKRLFNLAKERYPDSYVWETFRNNKTATN